MLDTNDDQFYKTRIIDGVTWMAENLNRDLKDSTSRCYNDSTKYCDEYGRLYTWGAAKTVCPKGWHLPSKEELENVASKGSGAIRSLTGWQKSSQSTDETGFSAAPAGVYGSTDFVVSFSGVGGENTHGDGEVVFWGNAESSATEANSLLVTEGFAGVISLEKVVNSTPSAYSVRCVKD